MNKDKRVVAQVLADLCGAYSGARTMPHKVLIVLHNAVQALADSEERSVKKMEPFKDNENTAANYRRGVEAVELLTAALEHISEGEMPEARDALLDVAVPPAPVVPVRKKTPSKKPLRKSRK